MFKQPDFWYIRNSACKKVLSPLSVFYQYGILVSQLFHSVQEINVPVICVGNLVVGGAGKTPTVLSIADILKSLGKKVHILTRGYGGKERGPILLDLDCHNAELVGDEPLLLAQSSPTWVSKDRVLGAHAAVKAGAEIILMDDGFQNLSLRKDLSFLVVDGTYGFGNECMIPAGPLREPIEGGIARADVVVVVGDDLYGVAKYVSSKPIIKAIFVPDKQSVQLVADRPVIAFAGIAHPDKFFNSVVSAGGQILHRQTFQDHHRFRQDEIQSLLEKANTHNALLLTTDKDHVRLSPEAKRFVSSFKVSLKFKHVDDLIKLLKPVLK
jgi:tetraacyldisaccharide 4'-kinase